MNKTDTISLLGCGWLGFPLATRLVSKGFPVKASTTSPEKIELFASKGIDPYLVQFSVQQSDDDVKKLLDAHTLIISIPPGRRNPGGFDSYRKMVETVCRLVPDSLLKRIILISSTSVYPDTDDVVTENTSVAPDTDSGRLMVETEIALKKLPVVLIVLRLSGLVGPDRRPGKFFAGKTSVANGQAPVNLVHRDDVVKLIEVVLEDPASSGIYNVCAPSHPSRMDFYQLAAACEALPEPEFINEKKAWKIVNSSRIGREIDFDFSVPDLIMWLKSDKRI